MILLFRSFIFNAALFGLTGLMCFLMLWVLPMPRFWMLRVVRLWLRQIQWIERHIGGIRWQVKGEEHIPSGPCIVAAKHQSAWETFKLHLLFDDPAIVLKRELLMIPLWGWYLKRAGVIAIDRAKGAKALSSMMASAREAARDGRKIVIFPQGTRVAPGAFVPYKSGLAGLYQELNLPVVPMALNSGLLWGKNSFIKKSGLVTVEFLPPIPPNLPRKEMMRRVQTDLEGASEKLASSGALGDESAPKGEE